MASGFKARLDAIVSNLHQKNNITSLLQKGKENEHSHIS